MGVAKRVRYRKILAAISIVVGFLLSIPAILSFSVEPPIIVGNKLLLLMLVYAGLPLILVPYSAVRLFVDRDEIFLQHKRAFMLSWVYLAAGIVASIAYAWFTYGWGTWPENAPQSVAIHIPLLIGPPFLVWYYPALMSFKRDVQSARSENNTV